MSSRFKVGDNVRVIGDQDILGLKGGPWKITEVGECTFGCTSQPGCNYRFRILERDIWWCPSNFEKMDIKIKDTMLRCSVF